MPDAAYLYSCLQFFCLLQLETLNIISNNVPRSSLNTFFCTSLPFYHCTIIKEIRIVSNVCTSFFYNMVIKGILTVNYNLSLVRFKTPDNVLSNVLFPLPLLPAKPNIIPSDISHLNYLLRLFFQIFL